MEMLRPASWSLRTRLVIGVALLYAILVGVFMLDLVLRQQRFLHNEQIENALSLSKGIARAGTAAVLAGDLVGVQEVLSAVVGTRELRYGFVIDDGGKVIAHTDRKQVGKYATDPVSQGLLHKTPEPLVVVDGAGIVDAAAPMVEAGRRIGWVRVGIGQEHTQEALRAVLRNGLLYALLAIFVGGAFAAWVGRRLTRGLYSLLQVAEATRDGDRHRRVEVLAQDEVGSVAQAFNGMLDRLVASESGLECLNEELEQRVEERTAALRAANEGVRTSEALLRLLLENLPQCIFYKDAHSVFRVVNPAFAQALGRRPEEIVGKSDFDFQDPARAEYIQELDRQVTSNGRRVEFDDEQVIEGEARTFHTMKVPVRDGRGEIVGLLGISWDITVRKRAEDALAGASRSAEAANRAKSDFLANMSHEIRTPMNAVIGLAHLLGQTHLDSRQRDYLDKIHSSANALLALLNSILDLSKVEADKLELEVRPFRLDRQMRDLATILSANAQHKDIEILFDVDPAVPAELVGDSLRLNQVLINLAGNAIKFTEHGEVVISVSPVEISEEQVVLNFSIRDTGIGITAEQRSRLFQAFNQGDSSTSRRFGGSGLGLAICRRLVQLMGGDLDVDSEPARGSNFHFTARFGRTQPQAAKPLLPRRVPAHLRVLVVDDNATAREVMDNLVSTFGWHADVVASGQEALALIETAGQSYDTIFLDWKMPGMDGLETSRRIRAATRGGQPPVIIVVTAYGREFVTRQAEGLDVNGMLMKPVTASMLFDAVADVFGAESAESGCAAAAGPASQPLAGLRLLVVEDNLINQQVASEMLVQAGAQVEMAGNGAQAVAMFRAGEMAFDAILMDIQMPEMDGYAATAFLRSLPEGRDIPIIAMTANAMAADRERCLAAGMNDHVAKPLAPDVLVRSISRAIHGQIEEWRSPAQASNIPAHLAVEGFDVASTLWRLGGDESIFQEMLGIFARHLPDSIEACGAAVANGDARAVEAAAHAVKGMAANLGAVALSRSADLLETAGREKTPHLWPEMLSEVQRSAVQVLKASSEAAARWSAMEKPVAAGNKEASLSEALSALYDLVADDNFAAVVAFDDLRPRLATRVGDGAVTSLAQAIETFDFDSAKPLLAGLMEKLR